MPPRQSSAWHVSIGRERENGQSMPASNTSTVYQREPRKRLDGQTQHIGESAGGEKTIQCSLLAIVITYLHD